MKIAGLLKVSSCARMSLFQPIVLLFKCVSRIIAVLRIYIIEACGIIFNIAKAKIVGN